MFKIVIRMISRVSGVWSVMNVVPSSAEKVSWSRLIARTSS